MKYLIGLIVGGIAGFIYYKKIGCPTGSCPLGGNPITSTFFGALTGFVIGSWF